MLVAIILGNRMNDDGSLSEKMLIRLTLAEKLWLDRNPDLIIVSGGMANPAAGVTEASRMKEYLVGVGIPEDKVLEEGKSMTTKENAKFAVPLAASKGVDRVILVTSKEHMFRRWLNPVKIFKRQLRKFPSIALETYCGI